MIGVETQPSLNPALLWRHGGAILCACGSIVLLTSPIRAEDAAPVDERMMAEMRRIAVASTIVTPDSKVALTLRDLPILRYSDPSRVFSDATLWLWTLDGGPAALLKIEAMQHWQTGEPQWGVCIASIASEPMRVTIGDTAPIPFLEAADTQLVLADADGPASTTAGRRLQIRSLSRRITVTLIEAANLDRQEMRMLPRPLYEFHNSDSKVLTGALVGWTSNGTNPDLVLNWHLDGNNNGQQQWQASPIRMTNGGLTLHIDDAPVWSCEPIRSATGQQQTWAFFQIPRESRFEKEGE